MKNLQMEDLKRERAQATFSVESMKIVWAGSQEALQMHNKLSAIVSSDPVFSKSSRPTMTRNELFTSGIRKAMRTRELVVQLGLSETDARLLRTLRDERAYDDLHWNMFVPVLRTQATAEQQKKWLPLATSMAIIGCYAQTELGHGSNVQGLETTATFDASTDEFVLNSPTLTSTKWWPGGLGKVATHAITHARLILEKDYGVHAFIVQIRSLEDHQPLSSIKVGDIGYKFGNGANNTVDNGFLQFKKTRIPRENLLMRMAEVNKEGKYIPQDVPKQILYGAMIVARQIILLEASVELSRAVTIAVRYSAVRRQFGLDNKNQEMQILDYMPQQQKLFPLLASAYAFQFAGQWMQVLYYEFMDQIGGNNFSALAEVHACTSGLKALTTSIAADGIETCRRACGGHGYLCSSGLSELFAMYIPACTYEGDNTILFIQVGKFLFKTTLKVKQGFQPEGTTHYLTQRDFYMENDCSVSKASEWSNCSVLLDAFKARSIRLVDSLSSRVQNYADQDIEDWWLAYGTDVPTLQQLAIRILTQPCSASGLDELSIDLVKVAQAHCQLIVLSKFSDKVNQTHADMNVKHQLEVLCYVYGLSLLCEHIGEFLATGYLTKDQAQLAGNHLTSLFHCVRPNAVALVDSFNHSDHFLGSVLGRYNGDAYVHLYMEALKEPLNKSVVAEGYEDYIKPLITRPHAAKL